jgi:hypothetical protein
MTGPYRSHVLDVLKRIVNFRDRWSNRSDTAIKAAVNHLHLWSRQMERRSAAVEQKETGRLH